MGMHCQFDLCVVACGSIPVIPFYGLRTVAVSGFGVVSVIGNKVIVEVLWPQQPTKVDRLTVSTVSTIFGRYHLYIPKMEHNHCLYPHFIVISRGWYTTHCYLPNLDLKTAFGSITTMFGSLHTGYGI